MKEFASQSGGRFTYIDDFLNLQNLALAFGAIFSDCDNFIVSGCEVSGNSISAGVVWLNGKLRIVEETPSITGGWPQYIYEVNEYKNVPYASGGEKVGRKEWGARVGKTVPTALTDLTEAVPKAIQINANGGLRLKEAFFGKYSLLLDSNSLQTIKGTVNIEKLNVSSAITSNSRFVLNNSSDMGCVYFEDGDLVFDAIVANANMQLIFRKDSGSIDFVINGESKASVRESGVVFESPIMASKARINSLYLQEQHIFNGTAGNDNGELNINLIGYNGGVTYARTTNIGDGKGNILFSVSGSNKTVLAKGELTIATETSVPLIFQAKQSKSDTSLSQYVAWRDVQNSNIATVGFRHVSNMDFSLINHIGDIVIQGLNAVNIVPAIKENGQLLSEKYITSTTLKQELASKVSTTDVYSKTETYSVLQADEKFATINSGLAQFVTKANSKKVLCTQIGALTQNDLDDYIKKDQFLSDIATSDSEKAKIRKNIGAAAALKDSLWLSIDGTRLWARQIGNIVCIQGLLRTKHDGIAFQIPNMIDPPKHAVGYSAPLFDEGKWGFMIEAQEKIAKITYCSRHDLDIPISITYMT